MRFCNEDSSTDASLAQRPFLQCSSMRLVFHIKTKCLKLSARLGGDFEQGRSETCTLR